MGCSSFREQSMVSCCACVCWLLNVWWRDHLTNYCLNLLFFPKNGDTSLSSSCLFSIVHTGRNVESFLIRCELFFTWCKLEWNEICLWKNQTGPIRVGTQCLFLLSAANHLPRLLCTFASRVEPAVGCCLGKEKKNQVSKATRSLSLHPGAAGWLTGSRARAAPRTRDGWRVSSAATRGVPDVAPPTRLTTSRWFECSEPAGDEPDTSSERSASGHLHNLNLFGPLWTVTILAARLPELKGLSECRREAEERGARGRK